MNTKVFTSGPSRLSARGDITLPVKRASVSSLSGDQSSKNLKSVISSQNSYLDRLTNERDELFERVRDLEERLSSSLAMIAVQKARIVNLSDLSAKLTQADGATVNSRTSPHSDDDKITEGDKLIVEQLDGIDDNQFELYLQHNPFLLHGALSSPGEMTKRMNKILKEMKLNNVVGFAEAALQQIFRASEISMLVQELRKSNYNQLFIKKIEEFCCRFFKAASCNVFTLKTQINILETYFENEGFTLQVDWGKGIVGGSAKNGKITIFQSTRDASIYDPDIDDFFNIGNNPSLLIPICDFSSNTVISIILVHTPKLGALFTPEDLQVAEILAQNLSPFITAYAESIEKTDDKSFRYNLTSAFKSLLGKNSIQELLNVIPGVLQNLINAENQELYIIDDLQNMLYVYESQTAPDEENIYVRKYFSGQSGIPFHVIQTISPFTTTRLLPETCEFFSRETDAKAIGKPYIAIPIIGIENRPIAVLSVFGKKGSNVFSQIDLTLLQEVATQIGINLINIFSLDDAHASIQCSTNADDFNNPLKTLITHIKKKTNQNKSTELISYSLSKELLKKARCDLVGIWKIIDGEPNQIFLYRTGSQIKQVVSVPPVVMEVFETGEVKKSSIASEVQKMIGNFDEEANYKSYSNITVPIKDDDDVILWIVMACNSLSREGRFSDNDTQGILDYSNFLLASSCVNALQDESTHFEKAKDFQISLIHDLTPINNEILSRIVFTINKYSQAKFTAIYQADGVADSLALTVSNYTEAPKHIPLTQGLIGKAFSTDESVCYNNVSNEPGFDIATDGFGHEDLISALYCKLSKTFLIVLLSPNKNCFNQSLIQSIKDTSKYIELGYELSSNSINEKSEKSQKITVEQRSEYMNRASNPSRADVEEYSNKSLNIAQYSEDDKIVMLLKMFVSQGIVRKLQVPFPKLVQFICAIRGNYNNVPYHNWNHACDVTQFVFSCITKGRLRVYLQEIEIFALLLASICHDVDHQGLNNAFHRKAQTPLGILYHERPVMEMHHIATALSLMSIPEHDILEGLDNQEDQTHFYEFFIKLILATDMEKHNAIIQEFQEIIKDFDKKNQRHRLLLAQILIKCGNMSNMMRSFDVVSDMAHSLYEEYFKQGDLEKKLGIEVSQMCDRNKPAVRENEIEFYRSFGIPLFELLSKLIPALADNNVIIDNNKKQWEQTQ